LSVIPALGMLRQEEFKIEFLSVYIVRPCLRKEEEKEEERKGGREEIRNNHKARMCG
jgi:hypothetical protein